MSEQIKETQCCPKFNPAPWDGKIFNWDNKIFVKDKVLTFFYIPINFGSVIKRIMKKVEQNGIKMTEWLGLSDHISKWSMDIYVAVDKEVTGANNVALSGKFFSKVYEGPYKNIGKWWKDFEQLAHGQNLNIKKQYIWYTTCPKCQKKYGKNYIVIIGEIASP